MTVDRDRDPDLKLPPLNKSFASFQDYIEAKFDQYRAEYKKFHQTRHEPSQNAFARYLGISASGLATYKVDAVVPNDDNLAKMASRLGNEVYTAAGRYRNPYLAPIVAGFDELSEADQKDLLAAYQQKRKEAADRAYNQAVTATR